MEEKTLPTAEQILIERNDPPPAEQTATEQTAGEQTRAGTIGAEGDAAEQASGNAAGKASGNAAEEGSLFRRLCGRPPRAVRRRLL